MGRLFFVILGILLLVGAIVLVIWREPGTSGAEVGRNRADPAGVKGRTATKRDPSGTPRTRFPVATRLRGLIEADLEAAPAFTELERMAGELADDEISNLLVAAAPHRADTLAGWIRCALFAERARRDPEGALELLTGSDSLRGWDRWALRQAWFSTFRGWAEVDPAAAAAKLSTFLGSPNRTGRILEPEKGFADRSEYLSWITRDDRWKQQTLVEVFARFVKSDPEAAWAAIPPRDLAGLRESALEGLFRGVEKTDFRWLLARWEPDWNTPEIRLVEEGKHLEEQKNAPRFSDEGASPDRDSVALRAALAMADFDLDEAIQWLRTSGSEPEGARYDRERRFYRLLAEHDPERVIALLQNGSEQSAFLLTGLVGAHPRRAAEYLRLVDDPDLQAGSLMMGTRDQSRLRLEDVFPAPGRSNRLPDYQERYHALLEAVQRGDFEAGQKDALLLRLHREFASVNVEAQAAAESAGGP